MNINTWIEGLNIPGKPDEWEVKELFKLYSINVPNGELIRFNDNFTNTKLQKPFVVKVCDPEILHKTDIGGVKLNIQDNLKETVVEMKSKFPGSNILIEEMVPYTGIEFIIGALVDPDFGPALMVGAGGILTELYKDVRFRLAPITKSEASRMLKELTVAEILQGYRGSVMELSSMADLVVSVGNLVNDLGKFFNQLDMNPVVFAGNKWVALDGMAILK